MQPNQLPHEQEAPLPPLPHQSQLAEFWRTCPTTVSQAKDPMEGEDWLKGIEKKLVIASAQTMRKFFLLHTSCTPSLASASFGSRMLLFFATSYLLEESQ
jgi:hypothetical protein